MKTQYRAPLIAVFLIVLLRMAIGWQFLYEGLWKKETLTSRDPWTSEGYLKNAQGPLRDYFREMTGDPDDLKWLDYATMSQKWYNWRDRFVSYYGLNEAQQKQLNTLLDGSAAADSPPADLPPARTVTQALGQLPEGVKFPKSGSVISYDADKKILVATAAILPSEEAALLEQAGVVRLPDGTYGMQDDPKQAPAPAILDFIKSVERLTASSRQLSFRHKLAAQLLGNPDNVGVTWRVNPKGGSDIVMGTTTAAEAGKDDNNVRYGKIQEYKDLVADYNANVAKSKMQYQTDHANMLGKKLAIMRSELVAPVRSLEKELKTSAMDLLTPEQLKKGMLANTDSPLAKSDAQVMWGLIILGIMLIAGFGTRIAAVLGAVMLMMFYMVMPPWPGVPAVPGPEHSFIVNKNMIEAIALLAIAALPTGSWFGIDVLFSRFLCCRSCKTPAPKPVELKKPVPAAK